MLTWIVFGKTQNINDIVVPFPGVESHVIFPLCILIICRDRLNPIPEPDSFVVKKGMKIFSAISASMPGPLSVTLSSTLPSVFLPAVIDISLP